MLTLIFTLFDSLFLSLVLHVSYGLSLPVDLYHSLATSVFALIVSSHEGPVGRNHPESRALPLLERQSAFLLNYTTGLRVMKSLTDLCPALTIAIFVELPLLVSLFLSSFYSSMRKRPAGWQCL